MASTFETIVANNLRRLRKERGLAQEELAHLAGLDKNHVGNIERQDNSPTVETLVKLANALNFDPIVLFQPEK